MEKIFYGSLGIALCITGIWTIISAFIPDKFRIFKKGRKENDFYDDEHEEMFNKLCGKMPYLDGYHLSLAYLLTMDAVLRYHIGALYDVKKDVIIFEGLSKPFQTHTSLKTTRLAFNLWNGTVYDSDPPETYIDKNGEKEYVPSKYYAPDRIFHCTYTPYYMEALKMRFEIFM